MRLTAKQILKDINCSHLQLVPNWAKGYWYFIYDNPKKNQFDTRSVYTVRLSDMPKALWVQEGKDFVEHMEAYFG